MRVFISILFLLVISNLLHAQQQQNTYEITGYIEGLSEGEKVVMLLASANEFDEPYGNMLGKTDSAFVKNGQFHIKGSVPDGPRAYWMSFDKHDGEPGRDHSSLKIIRLYINNGEIITIKSTDIDKIPHTYIQHYVTVSGSNSHYSRMCLEPARDVYSQSMSRLNNIIKSTKESSGFNSALLDGVIKSKDALNQSFYYNIFYGNERDPEIKDASITFISEFITSGHASFWADVYNNLSDKEKVSFYGKQLKERAIISVGQPFPEFILLGADGKNLSFKDMISKNKITIIHFWADNSIDRKAYQDELLFLYRKYHEKGLDIIGFSTDRYIDQWKEALEREKYPWHNVIDTKGSNGLAKKIYHEYSTDFNNNYLIHNTTNVLVDQQGKIIAWDVAGPELQYYLWKNLEN